MVIGTTDERQLFKPHLEASLPGFTVRTCLQAGGRWKVKVHKGHIGDGKSGCVGCFYTTCLWLTSVNGGVGDDKGVLKDEKKTLHYDCYVAVCVCV